MTDALTITRRNALWALTPPPRLSLSEWIETHMRLPEGVSALPGRVSLWPYQREIADAISDPTLERVTLVKPVRVGFTTLLTGALASYVANEPAPILALLPTEADCRDYTVSDLEPIFEATPALRGLISADADDTGRSTLMSRRFPGGSLKIIAAKSPRNLRRHNVRVLLIDEADAMEPGVEGSPITLAERRTLSFANGRWRATEPHVEGHAGFRLNALVSTLANASWAKLAAEFVEAKKQPDTLQVFVNTILAQGWREAAEEIDEAALAERAEPFGLPDAIPADVLFVTAGVDVQRDRLEVVFLGWGRDEIFVLSQFVIWGNPMTDDVWMELDDALKTIWKHPKGGILRVDAAAVDAGDGETMDRVIAFCRPRSARRVYAIKGAAGNRPVIRASDTRGSRLFIVGVDSVKGQLTSRLSRGKSVRFSDSLEGRFYEELASERLVMRYVKGAPVRQWERIPGRRAESLDCVVYAMAVRALINARLDRREEDVAQLSIAPTTPAVVKSQWLSR